MSNRRKDQDVILQPWFLPRELRIAVIKLLPPHYLTKMREYFDTYGCMKCERKDVLYHGNGMCIPCCNRFIQRLKRCAKRCARRHEKQVASYALNEFAGNAQIARNLLSDLVPGIVKPSNNPVRDLSGRRGRS